LLPRLFAGGPMSWRLPPPDASFWAPPTHASFVINLAEGSGLRTTPGRSTRQPPCAKHYQFAGLHRTPRVASL
jgi:hypothetical protein